MKRKIILPLVVIIVIIGSIRLIDKMVDSGGKKGTGHSAEAIAVETKPVQKGTILDLAVFTGSLEPRAQFSVAPKVAGWLKKLLVDVGDEVERNQVIALLDDEEFAQHLEQAKAELLVTKANAENSASDLDLVKREYERVKSLREKQIASAVELDESEAAFNAGRTKYKVSLAQVAQKQAALKTAEVQLSYTKVQAFWEEGDKIRVVGERFVDEGTLLQVNQPIVSILENNPLTAVVYVIERDYPKVKIGQEAIITTDAYPDKTFAGKITRIAPLLKESSRQARIEVEVPNTDHLLKPGMFVRARVEFTRHENATLVPFTAIVKRNGKDGVFIVDEENLKANFVAVVQGIVSDEQVEILEPAISGLIVTMGNHLLENGSDITLPADSSKVTRDTGAGDFK